MYTGYYVADDGHIFGPNESGLFYIDKGYIHGPRNGGKYSIGQAKYRTQAKYIFGPIDNGQFYITNDGHIHGPTRSLPWMRRGQ